MDFFKNCFDNYTGELSILVDSLQNDDKEITEPNLAFINLFYFPFYYAILKNNNEISILIDNIENSNDSKLLWEKFYLMPYYLSRNIRENYLRLNNEKKYSLENEIKKNIYFNSEKLNVNTTNNNCYIATLAYNDINHPKVNSFRSFRDNYLLNYHLGILFIKFYYKLSPNIVSFLRPYKTINSFIRFLLDVLLIILPSKK